MKKFAIAMLMLLVSAGALFAQADLQPLVVVKLNKNETITVKQLKSRVDTYQKQIGKSLSIDEKKMVLDSLIEERLILQAAQKAGLSIPDSVVDQYFLQGMSQQVGANVTEKELNDLIKKSQGITLDQLLQSQVGMNVAEYKAYLKNQLIAQQYVVQQKQAELQAVAPTDDEIRLFYESNKASFVWNDMMKVFMVIVPAGNNPDAAKNKMSDIRNKIVDGKMTIDQVIVQSKVADSGYQAGEMILPKIEASALSLGMSYQNLLYLFSQDEGFISDLQETDVDYRIISVRKKYSAKMLTLSDVVQPETTVTVYDYIRQNLAQQKQMQFIQVAAQEIAKELNTDANVERKKTGAALDKLLEWGE